MTTPLFARKHRRTRVGDVVQPFVGLLVRDDVPDAVDRRNLRHRRRGDCAHLNQCEDAWCVDHAHRGSVTAMGSCPPHCASYVRRDDIVPATAIVLSKRRSGAHA